MKLFSKKILPIILLLLPVISIAQDLDAHSPKQSDPITKQQKSAEKKKAKRIARQEKSDKLAQKHAIQLQSKEVRKRMKKSRKKADKWNENK